MLNYLSLFSGIGAFEKALTNINEGYNLVGYCEIDKYASKAYSLIHNVPESMNVGDVRNITDTTYSNVDIDLITYGFPCQDISLAGKQAGFIDEDGNVTRSGLFFEALRVISLYKPKYAIAENVKNLTGKRFSKEFETVLESLERVGYRNYWKVLNAKDYGMPQSRDRVFIVSVRDDIDEEFKFPEPINLDKRLSDYMDDEVDDKYLIYKIPFEEYQKKKEILYRGRKIDGFTFDEFPNDTDRVMRAGVLSSSQDGVVVDSRGLSPTHTAGHGNCPKVIYRKVCDDIILTNEKLNCEDVKYGDLRQIGYIKYPKSSGNHQSNRFYDSNGIAPSLDTCAGGNRQAKVITDDLIIIRKLTPKECLRIMGFTDADFNVLNDAKISDAQLYKMAGNSIVVNVLMHLFEKLLR